MRLDTGKIVAAIVVTLMLACRASASSQISATATVAASAKPSGPGVPAPKGAVSVKDFGAKGDGVSDDRRAIQAAIDAAKAGSGDVFIPPGTYNVSQAGRSYWCLDVPSGVRIHGAGQRETVLRMARRSGRSVRLMRVSGDDILVERLTLDGNKRAQAPDEQKHGIFALRTNRLIVRNVTARDFTGDGFYLSIGAKDSLFFEVLATRNDRSGLALGAMIDGTKLVNSRFIANRAQQIDSEPVGLDVVSNTTVTGCTIDGAGVSNEYVLTVSGTPKVKGRGWNIVDNRINGGVFVVWTQGVVIERNHGVNPTTKPSVTVYRGSADVTVSGNRFKLTQNSVRSVAGVLVQGAGTGDAPDRVLVSGNELTLTHAASFGVRAEGAIDVTVVDNDLRGSGAAAPLYAGIYLRATNPKEDFRRAVVRGNTIRDFGDRGISVVGNGAAKLLSVEIRDNVFDNEIQQSAMTTGLSLDDGTGAARKVTVSGNRSLRGVSAPLINRPSKGAAFTVDEPSQQALQPGQAAPGQPQTE